MFSTNKNVRTFSSFVTMVMAFLFLVAATPPTCSDNAAIQYQDNGKTYLVRVADLKSWATTQALATGDARYVKLATMAGYVQTGQLNSYVLSSTITNYVSKTSLGTTLNGYATKSDLAKLTTDTGSNLNAAAKKSDLVGLLKISDLVGYAKKTDLNAYATKEQVGIVSAALQSLASALNLDSIVAGLKDLFAEKSEVAATYATKEELAAVKQAIPAVTENPEIPAVVETTSGESVYQYEEDPSFPENVYWYVDITSKSQPTYTVGDPKENDEYINIMNQLAGAIAVIRPDLPAVNNTGKVNITLARNQVNGVTSLGTQYQSIVGLVELLKHGYDDNYFGIVKLTDGRFFVGKRNGNSVEVIYSNEVSIEGTYITAFYSRVDCIQFSSDM